MSAFRGLSSSSSSEDEGSAISRRSRSSSRSSFLPLVDASPDASDDDSDTSVALPSDVEAALRYLRPFSRPRIVLQHHIYSVLKDRTAVDREVLDLAEKGKIRKVQLPSGSDDVGIFGIDDWIEECERLPEDQRDAFRELSKTPDLYVRVSEGAANFCKAGLLRPRRDVDGANFYWFACPDYGNLAKKIQFGRDLLLATLSAARRNEINLDHCTSGRTRRLGKRMTKLAGLEDLNDPHYCHGGLKFFVDDLLGRDLATLHARETGRFLKLR